MKYPLLGKLVALGAVTAVLLVALGMVNGIVEERQRRQAEAEQGVAGSLAGAQTLLGPALQRLCQESWTRTEGEGKDSKPVNERREFRQLLWPQRLVIKTRASIEPRYRGLFKVNGYLTQSTLVADWADASFPALRSELAGTTAWRSSCEAPTLAVAFADARGVRSAKVSVDGAALPVRPGSGMNASAQGLHVLLPEEPRRSAALHAELALDLVGTASLAWVPVGDETRVQVTSDWAHPSFSGQFLPVSRQVTPQGFEAQWQTSALATSAQRTLRNGATLCALRDSTEAAYAGAESAKANCVDSFGVHFIDPVSPYVLSDRATKYGLLFIGLTFVGVALVEVMRRLRVHPVQYLLVGCALTVFFLLLISLSEHIGFALAYLCASAACTALLTFYGTHVLSGRRPGAAFGAGIAVLYGALYALLQLEQTALALGSLLLFAVLAAVMVATRKMDWYALAAQLNDAPPPAMQPAPGTAAP